MPFFDDSGIRLEEHRGLLWRTIALFGDQIERMVAANLGWSLHLLPAVIAFAFPGLPLALRILFIGYSSIAIIPATAVLYGLAAAACEGEQLDLHLAREMWDRLARPAFHSLLPLYSMPGLLWGAATLMAPPLPVEVLLRLVLLVGVVLAGYWGPALVDRPQASALELLFVSLRLFWRHPGRTLLLVLLVALLALLATISIGGLFLAAPVLIALLQVQQFKQIHAAPAATKG
jgi:hypothetical protein